MTDFAPVVSGAEIKKLKAKAEKRKVWNWWTATDERKAEWIAQIELWLTDYHFRFFPQMANRKHVPECWKLHPDWLEYLGDSLSARPLIRRSGEPCSPVLASAATGRLSWADAPLDVSWCGSIPARSAACVTNR